MQKLKNIPPILVIILGLIAVTAGLLLIVNLAPGKPTADPEPIITTSVPSDLEIPEASPTHTEATHADSTEVSTIKKLSSSPIWYVTSDGDAEPFSIIAATCWDTDDPALTDILSEVLVAMRTTGWDMDEAKEFIISGAYGENMESRNGYTVYVTPSSTADMCFSIGA